MGGRLVEHRIGNPMLIGERRQIALVSRCGSDKEHDAHNSDAGKTLAG
jgi:hypothetical protein